jgi:purine nucleoside permease
VPKFDYRTEMFRLDEALLQKALSLSKSAVLEDSEDLRAYRQHYPEAPANQPPTVIQCDTLSGDTWWSGNRLGEHARRWTRLLTDGKGVYCTTQQEDNATLNALTRGSQSGLVDLKRIAVLRSGSDFDRPYPHQSVLESMQAQRALAGCRAVSAVNLVHAGMPLVEAIVQHWDCGSSVPVAPVPMPHTANLSQRDVSRAYKSHAIPGWQANLELSFEHPGRGTVLIRNQHTGPSRYKRRYTRKARTSVT